MGKIAIVTDSNSGITQAQAEELGVYVIPMPFYINEKMYLEGVTLTQEEFYEKLKKDEPISTSQPSPADLCDLWDKLLRDYEEIVHIPMSSGLSASCSTAMGLAIDYNGRVQVVDNQRISVTQRQSVMDAKMLAEAGKSAAEIKKILTDQKLDSSIYITLDTLKYLKKGGRITPAAAAIGTVLNLKPVLQIQGEKLDAYAKVRGKRHNVAVRRCDAVATARYIVAGGKAGNTECANILSAAIHGNRVQCGRNGSAGIKRIQCVSTAIDWHRIMLEKSIQPADMV